MLQLVRPVLAQALKPVTQELDSFLSQGLSEGHGAVFVSMGTLARMNRDELHSMAQALSALSNPVLWKLNPLHLPGVLCVLCRTVLQPFHKGQVCIDVMCHLPVLSRQDCKLVCASTNTRLGQKPSDLCFVVLVIFFLEDGNACSGTTSSGIVHLGS